MNKIEYSETYINLLPKKATNNSRDKEGITIYKP